MASRLLPLPSPDSLDWNLTSFIHVRKISRALNSLYRLDFEFPVTSTVIEQLNPSTKEEEIVIQPATEQLQELTERLNTATKYPSIFFILLEKETTIIKKEKTRAFGAFSAPSHVTLFESSNETESIISHSTIRMLSIVLERAEIDQYFTFELSESFCLLSPFDLSVISMLNLYTLIQVQCIDKGDVGVLQCSSILEEATFKRFYNQIGKLAYAMEGPTPPVSKLKNAPPVPTYF